ncbi:MAG: biopolymer transporter ExbD [Proteobacteria bacterium]|jgi:biopolymer transport protein TolR|nr:biopolymer transporter ExbD [Pseudomonadota bacterium]
MGMSSGESGRAMADINVTPLVDVMLVLLIIFMITAPMLNNAGVEIDLPKADAPPLDLEADPLVLAIDGELNYFIKESMFTLEEMKVKLPAIAKANPDEPVFLKADKDVPYGKVAQLLGIAKNSGMPRVGLVFDPTALGLEEEP